MRAWIAWMMLVSSMESISVRRTCMMHGCFDCSVRLLSLVPLSLLNPILHNDSSHRSLHKGQGAPLICFLIEFHWQGSLSKVMAYPPELDKIAATNMDSLWTSKVFAWNYRGPISWQSCAWLIEKLPLVKKKFNIEASRVHVTSIFSFRYLMSKSLQPLHGLSPSSQFLGNSEGSARNFTKQRIHGCVGHG